MADIKCINGKGFTVWIPEHLLTTEYKSRHGIYIDDVAPQEELKPIEQVNFEVVTKEAPKEVQEIETFEETPLEKEEIKADSIELSKEDYFKILDEKGVEYKKTYGIAKLKELCQ